MVIFILVGANGRAWVHNRTSSRRASGSRNPLQCSFLGTVVQMTGAFRQAFRRPKAVLE